MKPFLLETWKSESEWSKKRRKDWKKEALNEAFRLSFAKWKWVIDSDYSTIQQPFPSPPNSSFSPPSPLPFCRPSSCLSPHCTPVVCLLQKLIQKYSITPPSSQFSSTTLFPAVSSSVLLHRRQTLRFWRRFSLLFPVFFISHSFQGYSGGMEGGARFPDSKIIRGRLKERRVNIKSNEWDIKISELFSEKYFSKCIHLFGYHLEFGLNS